MRQFWTLSELQYSDLTMSKQVTPVCPTRMLGQCEDPVSRGFNFDPVSKSEIGHQHKQLVIKEEEKGFFFLLLAGQKV